MKRTDYISFDELYMGIAELASKRSKDPSTRHGACIINKYNRIISIGYNGLPKGLNDDGYNESGSVNGVVIDYWLTPNKYPYVVHAEENAILNATVDLKDTILYLYSEKGYYPCSTCARMMSQTGIKEVVMKTAIRENTPQYDWSHTKHIFEQARITIRVLNNDNKHN